MAAPHPASPGTQFQFSTDAFAPRERLAASRDIFGREVARIDITPLENVPFHAHMSVQVLPDLVVVSGHGTARTTGRTRELLADGDDSLLLHIATCPGNATLRGQDIAVAANDAMVLPTSEIGSFTFSGEQSILVLNLPRATLGPFLHEPDAIFMRTIPHTNEALRLLTSYVGMLRSDPPIGEDLLRAASAHVHDLAALVLGATRDAGEVARRRGLRAARIDAARTYIKRHLARESLSAADVAAHLGVTPRYVYMLFEAEGVSFSEFILTERLARAHRMLTAPRHAGMTISAIAFELGFIDLSHFNRSFRRRYGCTPSDVRAARHGGDRA